VEFCKYVIPSVTSALILCRFVCEDASQSRTSIHAIPSMTSWIGVSAWQDVVASASLMSRKVSQVCTYVQDILCCSVCEDVRQSQTSIHVIPSMTSWVGVSTWQDILMLLQV